MSRRRHYQITPRRNWLPLIFFTTHLLLWGGLMTMSMIFQYLEDPLAAVQKLKDIGHAAVFFAVTVGPYYWWLQVNRPDEM